jgi:hypothetical protein
MAIIFPTPHPDLKDQSKTILFALALAAPVDEGLIAIGHPEASPILPCALIE